MNLLLLRLLLLISLCTAGLSSCIMQSALHRPVFDRGREGTGLLVKGASDVVQVGEEWELVADSVTVHHADSRMFIEAHPARFVRRNREWLLTMENDHPRYVVEVEEAPVVYGEVIKDRSGYLVRTQTPWQNNLPSGAVRQSGKLLLPDAKCYTCNKGIILVSHDLQANAHALWAYPLGSVLTVADAPLTVALHGLFAVAVPVVYTYDKLTGRPYLRNQEPPVRKHEQ
ncbi:MAG: hypothetical protein IJ498_00370 [Akkermansia sp.]|nr:hypothetical protein [Akkermansia sp.]